MRSVQVDSRCVCEGDVFVAIPCRRVKENVADAVSRKASVIVLYSWFLLDFDLF